MLQTLSLRILFGLRSMVETVRNDERAQDTLEWAMLGGLVALGILAVTQILTGALTDMMNGIGNCIDFDDATVCNAGF